MSEQIKILITGANGQLGNELQSVLSQGNTDMGPIPKAYEHASIIATDSDTLDITDAATTCAFIRDVRPDIIINCAAYTNVDACESDSVLAQALNADAVGNIAKAASESGSKLVHISTDYVFSGEEEVARTELDSPCPRSVYGKTKLAGELQVQAQCKRYFIVRTAWLYGKKGNNFVKTILRLAQENGNIKVVSDQYGNPTNANDLVHMLLKLALTEHFGVYNCTGNGICSWFDFASAIVDIANIPCTKTPCTSAEFPRPAARPHFSALDNSRLNNTINDKMRDWRVALNSYLKSYPELLL
ncbi:MAG: dTDP-4-dehydrorhamnose reductase [Coriobacteriales bacterium]|jgi:dTDP-4-dehydrorhamnose reductase|nr:dTDP-4-dehydrorhamnose reductase [Coriobacteriales bacterium]